MLRNACVVSTFLLRKQAIKPAALSRGSISTEHLVVMRRYTSNWTDVVYTTCSNITRGFLALVYLMKNERFKKSKSHRKITIAVEGNIGSGKTSLLNYFMKNPFVEVYKEPVDKWRNINGKNALALMYEDPDRWSLTFQTYVQLTMLETHSLKQDKPIKMMERSLFSAKYCFVENLYKSGKMPEIEYIILTKWFDWICKNEDVKLDLIVYLRTKPETVYERIKQRHRKEEATIPIEYLQSLHELHEDWLIKKKFECPAKVLVLEADCGMEDIKTYVEQHYNEILCQHS